MDASSKQQDASDLSEVETEACVQNDSCDNLDVKDMTLCLDKKELGNNLFRMKKFEESISAYSEAIHFCPISTQEERENMAVFHGNRAAAYFSLKEYDATVDDCNEALVYSPNYTKVLYRRGLAFEYLERLEESLQGIVSLTYFR
jgi:tetratricopeptide (TPR) repeat protein